MHGKPDEWCSIRFINLPALAATSVILSTLLRLLPFVHKVISSLPLKLITQKNNSVLNNFCRLAWDKRPAGQNWQTTKQRLYSLFKLFKRLLYFYTGLCFFFPSLIGKAFIWSPSPLKMTKDDMQSLLPLDHLWAVLFRWRKTGSRIRGVRMIFFPGQAVCSALLCALKLAAGREW